MRSIINANEGINASFNGVLCNVMYKYFFMNKILKSIQIIRKAEKLALTYKDYGFHVAFSGGKDSQVIYELCRLAGVKFKAFFYKTSVDPVELLSFIRNNYPDVEWLRPELTMYQLILKEGWLPMRQFRYCCRYLKESHGLNSVVITGVTKYESSKRRNAKVFSENCIKGKDKILLNPILDWTVKDVYEFLQFRNIKICDLYKVNDRIGCIGCPNSPKKMRKDFAIYPNFKKAYINTVKKLIDKGKYSEFKSAEEVIEWWSSGENKDTFLYRKKYQTNIDFTYEK